MITRNPYSLNCANFNVDVSCDGFVRVSADFVVLIAGRDEPEKIAEALRRIGLTLCSGPIDLVKATDKPRCFYCGSLNDEDRNTCSQCSGSL